MSVVETSYITRSGKAECLLMIPNNATACEKYAAQELQSHIKMLTGVRLSISPERSYYKKRGAYISIGRTIASQRVVSEAQMKAFGAEGYSIFTKDGHMFIVGSRTRGVMYAVSHFLETLGIRWYSPDYTYIPQLSTVKMPAKPVSHKSVFYYRDQWWNNAPTPEWKARMRINGNNGQVPRLPDEMGGSAVTLYGCHSYFIIVPPEKHYEEHPDWFALKEDGKRSRSELCLTNPELRKFVIKQVGNDLIARHGKVDNYWLSQNDGGLSGCFCDRCTKERMAHGGKDRWSANTIKFTSEIADAVRKDYPDVRIKTLAYTYTQTAPENMKASDCICVEICGNFVEGDKTHFDLVNSWSKVAKNISVYTYGGSNYGYWWPYPNAWEVGMQYQWAQRCGVKAFYIQGTALGKGSGLVDLKAYLSTRMAWDPSRDVKSEIRQFCKGFYGPGGKYIVEYLEWYSRYIKGRKMPMEGGWGDAEVWRKWVTREAMQHCDELFQKAILATGDNPIYLKHVRRAYLEVLWGRIMVDTKPDYSLMSKEWQWQPGADESLLRDRAKLFGKIMRESGYNMQSEIVPFDESQYPH